MPLHLWLRDETKPLEARAPLTPAGVKELLRQGARVFVERSRGRVFSDDEYAAAGATLVDSGGWRGAPDDAFILGLKELPEPTGEADRPLRHRHIYFAHAYKEQRGWQDVLRRFVDGGGALYDLEHLKAADGRRVAAFGYWAGYVGAGVAALVYAHRRRHGDAPLPPLRPWSSRDSFVAALREALEGLSAPKVIVIGARGRCGRGACTAAADVGAVTTEWDLEETRGGGPFAAILEHDILVNAVLVQGPVPPFLTKDTVAKERRLSVIADVSCDPTGPYNPLPLYRETTSFDSPTVTVAAGLELIAIDHLPSLLPRESSEDFGAQLLPHLAALVADGSDVWRGAEHVFQEKSAALRGK
jgi:saccharopine dehydrogenase (NAD+, L-lysine forming)